MRSEPLHLGGLPDEVLDAIFSFLRARRDLVNIACVSRRFQHLSEPFLYRSIQILQGSHGENLAYAITRRFSRAKFVKSLLLSPSFGEDEGLKRLPFALRLMTNLKELRLETPDCNSKKPDERIPWVNLQERYERIFGDASIIVPELNQRALPQLQTCTLHFVDRESELYGLSEYATLFLHPRLRSLTISCASTDFPHELLRDLQNDEKLHRSTPLEELHLEECDIHGGSLAILLSFPRALRSLKISEGIRYSEPNGYHPRKHGDISPVALVEALKRQRRSLQSLSLSLGYVRPRYASINDHGEHLNLTDFDAVRHLELSHRTLSLVHRIMDCDHALWRRLPPQLQSLKIFEVPLLIGRQQFRHLLRPYFPFELCLMQRKAEHGVRNLSKLNYSYIVHGQEDVEEGSDGEGDVDPHTSQIIQEKEKARRAAQTHQAELKAAGLQLRLDVVSLHRGFIPPYLYKEIAPRETLLFDSLLEASTANV